MEEAQLFETFVSTNVRGITRKKNVNSIFTDLRNVNLTVSE